MSKEQRYFKVTEKQKTIIEYKVTYENASPEEIRSHPSLVKPNGQLHRLSTIKKWINRFKETGNMKEISIPGRPKKLTDSEERDVFKFVTNNPKWRYPAVKRQMNLNVHPKTINRIANKRGI